MKREHEDEGVENEDNEDEIPQGQDEINQYNNQQDVDNHYDDDSSIQEQSNFLNTNEQSESGSNQMNQDFLDGTMAKRQKRSDDEEIRLLIPSKFAGAIIGKGGQNIQKLRTEFKAQVNVGDCQGPERVITLSSDSETCFAIVRDILKHFDKTNGDESELRVLLHQSLAGCVIGKNGSKIKEIKDKTGCRLKIFSNIAPQSTDRVAQIIGKEHQCIECLQIVLELLKSTPVKGPVHNYDPHNFDDMYAEEYGGYGGGFASNTGNFRGMGQGGQGGGRFDGRGGGGNRFADRNVNGRGNSRTRAPTGTRDFIDPWAHTGSNPNSQLLGSSFGALASLNDSTNINNGNSNNGSSIDMENKSSTQVTIPKDLAGAIIGKGGGRIRRIRSESNAFIQIDEALPGSTDRIITITGTPKQIQTAQYMLQQSVRDNMRKN